MSENFTEEELEALIILTADNVENPRYNNMDLILAAQRKLIELIPNTEKEIIKW